jgi:endonuclease YncB( thermonuclease family)
MHCRSMRSLRSVLGSLFLVALLGACGAVSGGGAVETSSNPGGELENRVLVSRVVDGDTVEIQGSRRVRLIGIDTPERGECGYEEAAALVRDLLEGKPVELVYGAAERTDRYGRELAYLEIEGYDVGMVLLEAGWARARYDSRDGYGRHPREEQYIASDADTPAQCG